LGVSAILVRSAGAPGVVSSFYRMLIATLLLAVPFVRRIRTTNPPARRAIWIAILGGTLFAADLATWATGVTLSGATVPTLLGNTAPVWVGLGTLLIFRRQLGIGFWIGTLVAMLGAGLVLGIETSDEVVGAILGLIAGVFYGGYFLVTQRGRELLDSLTYFWLASASSAVVLMLLAAGFRMPLTGYPASSYLNFLAMGVITQVFGYLAVSYALGRFPASIVAPTLLGQPVITALLAVPLLGEILAPLQILGGAAVLAGVVIVHRGQSN